ncbi:MAG: cytochrome c [Chloroflexi bacterium]|nr:cytochrome c [Chloroflexota bacterium]
MKLLQSVGLSVVVLSLLLVAASIVAAQEGTPDPALFMPTEAELAATPPDPASDDPVVRGEYLVRVQMACVGCHGTFTAGGPLASVNPLTSELAGGEPFDIPDVMTVYSANLTQLGDWTDDQIETAIRYGIRPDGTGIAPIMPFPLYQQITAQDMSDIIAYLRTLEPVDKDIPEAEFKAPGLGREAFAQMYTAVFDMEAEPPAPDFSDPLTRGTYLANVSNCMHCHGQLDMQTFLPTPAPEGLPWGDLVGASLLPFNMTKYTDEQIDNLLHTGIEEDGEMALGMPWPSFQHMPETDHQALIAWIRSQPDVQPEDRAGAMTGAPEATPATTPEASG